MPAWTYTPFVKQVKISLPPKLVCVSLAVELHAGWGMGGGPRETAAMSFYDQPSAPLPWNWWVGIPHGSHQSPAGAQSLHSAQNPSAARMSLQFTETQRCTSSQGTVLWLGSPHSILFYTILSCQCLSQAGVPRGQVQVFYDLMLQPQHGAWDMTGLPQHELIRRMSGRLHPEAGEQKDDPETCRCLERLAAWAGQGGVERRETGAQGISRHPHV